MAENKTKIEKIFKTLLVNVQDALIHHYSLFSISLHSLDRTQKHLLVQNSKWKHYKKVLTLLTIKTSERRH